MKPILLYIFALFTFFTLDAQKNGLEIYLVKRPFPDFSVKQGDNYCYYCFEPKEADLFPEPLITENDIEYFDWDKQKIKLNIHGKSKIDSLDIPLQGIAVAMVLNGKPIYGFWFWNLLSSFGCDRVYTYPAIGFEIEFGLPDDYKKGEDPRYDEELFEYLKTTTLLRQTPGEEYIPRCLEDSSINQYYKDIFKEEYLIFLSDEDLMLSVTDSLFSLNSNRQLFFFIVFTKSMNGSDGFYSEALGLNALNFISTYTVLFAEYFSSTKYLNESDFQNWIRSVCGEIIISAGDEKLSEINNLVAILKENIKDSNYKQKIIIDRFTEGLIQSCK